MAGKPQGVPDRYDDTPPPQAVAKLHYRSDVDAGAESQHHTLGIRKNQASDGAHNHDGQNSVQLLEGVTITGAKAGNTALASVIAVLVGLGATDSTT